MRIRMMPIVMGVFLVVLCVILFAVAMKIAGGL